VDDERSVRRIVRKTLEQFGYAVLEAANGEEGIRLFTEQGPRIQLVILDIVMPGISGWDVLRAIKAHRPALPVIVQSGYVVSGNHPEDTPLKADAFLRKPYELAELLQTVRQVLDAPAYRNR
jgi:CheY-like chemotaxis protein